MRLKRKKNWLYKSLIKRIRQMFCRHKYVKYIIPNAYFVKDGWMVRAYEFKCEKCGKVLSRRFRKGGDDV